MFVQHDDNAERRLDDSGIGYLYMARHVLGLTQPLYNK